MRWASTAMALLAVGCGHPPVIVPDPGATPSGCRYPEGALEPMTEGEPIAPYLWPSALDAQRTPRSLSLLEVHCNEDADFDWTPFDFMLIVSLPAW
jgi:hypothetical protein